MAVFHPSRSSRSLISSFNRLSHDPYPQSFPNYARDLTSTSLHEEHVQLLYFKTSHISQARLVYLA